ncbi:MAG: hypothetical protein IKR05_07940 [Prevotella sp.]|nr:hypothetical protein [Prevotella sp.]MBR6263133.1 hypothetical protein [Prevotella sp.]
MKRNLFIVVALVATMTAVAQNIAVVSPDNVTDIYQTLGDAIANAAPGSTIYLPGGGHQISDETKIDKKLTIMGVSHRGDTDNVDGGTIISGNLNFIGGSSGSAVLGVYISGNINVGTSEEAVENFTVKYCNASYIFVSNSASSGMVVNQCYLRSGGDFGNTNVKIENNIINSLRNINGGVISNNIIFGFTRQQYFSDFALLWVSNSAITNNFLLYNGHFGDNCYVSNNCYAKTALWGDNPIILDEGVQWEDVFVKYDDNNRASINLDYRLKQGIDKSKFMGTDGKPIGIEGGSGFTKDALAPIPRIVSKKVDEQSDASGKLTIEVTVKAQ